MKREEILLWKPEEYHYELAYGCIPKMNAYLQEDENEHPCMIVVPGGGYRMVSPTEAEPVALKFFDKGYQVFVCTYTTDVLGMVPLKGQPLADLSRAIRIIRKNAKEYGVAQDKVVICGFSAGAHASGTLCVHYEDAPEPSGEYAQISNRPDASILSYPVITSGEYAHRDSFNVLLGKDASEEELAYMSLEKQVTENTPPAFLWQTATDETVPVENSALYAAACKKHGVPFAHHVFSEGPHGLSTADGNVVITEENSYTSGQIMALGAALQSGECRPAPEVMEHLQAMKKMAESMESGEGNVSMPGTLRNAEAAAWVDLAAVWLEKQLSKK